MTVSYDENIEISVLASVVQRNENFSVIEDIVEDKVFWWRPFGYCWKAFVNLHNEELSIDKISLLNEMKRNNWLDSFAISSVGMVGEPAIDFLFDFKINMDNAETYAYSLLEAYGARKSIEALDNAKQAILKGSRVSDAWVNLDIESGKITSMVGAKANTISTAFDAVQESLIETQKAMEGLGVITPTGLRYIDYFTGGLARKRVYMISGGTGDGKSSMLSSIINQMTVENKKKHKMGWISLEMDKRECINRIISNQTGISALRLDMGKITAEEFKEYQKWLNVIKDAPILIDDSSELTFPMLKTKMRKMAEAGVISIGIDQLELMTFPPAMMSMPEHTRFNWGSYKIKAYAKELDINALILHQISRDINKGQNRGKDVKPVVQDIASGGDRGVDAVFIIRHNQDRTESYNNCVKNRQGIAGKRVAMNYIGERMRFEDAKESFPEGFEEQVPEEVMEEYQGYEELEQEIAP